MSISKIECVGAKINDCCVIDIKLINGKWKNEVSNNNGKRIIRIWVYFNKFRSIIRGKFWCFASICDANTRYPVWFQTPFFQWNNEQTSYAFHMLYDQTRCAKLMTNFMIAVTFSIWHDFEALNKPLDCDDLR